MLIIQYEMKSPNQTDWTTLCGEFKNIEDFTKFESRQLHSLEPKLVRNPFILKITQ